MNNLCQEDNSKFLMGFLFGIFSPVIYFYTQKLATFNFSFFDEQYRPKFERVFDYPLEKPKDFGTSQSKPNKKPSNAYKFTPDYQTIVFDKEEYPGGKFKFGNIVKPTNINFVLPHESTTYEYDKPLKTSSSFNFVQTNGKYATNTEIEEQLYEKQGLPSIYTDINTNKDLLKMFNTTL